MRLPYAKYHGLGNDFIIVDANDVFGVELAVLAKKLCNRHTGIGADGLIVVQQNPLEMIYYNSDGSRAKMCGNGIRCFANYCVDHQIVSNNRFDVKTLAGIYQITIESQEPFVVTVNMGKPDFTPVNIPVLTQLDRFIDQVIEVNDNLYSVSSVFMGTVHTTIEVDELETVDMIAIGKAVQENAIFPDSTNVNFYQVVDSTSIKIQTYERGAGLTLACGTGATAVYAILRETKRINHPVTFHLPLGVLSLQSAANGDIMMTGPATFVFAGEIGVIV